MKSALVSNARQMSSSMSSCVATQNRVFIVRTCRGYDRMAGCGEAYTGWKSLRVVDRQLCRKLCRQAERRRYD